MNNHIVYNRIGVTHNVLRRTIGTNSHNFNKVIIPFDIYSLCV